MKDRIINLLSKEEKSYTVIDIKDILGLNTTEELETMFKALNELESELKVYHTNKDKYMLFEYSHLKKGKLSVSEKGFGFVLMDPEPDIYVSSKSLNGARDGDLVIVEIIDNSTGAKKEGRVLRIAKRTYGPLIGEIYKEHDILYLKVRDRKFKQKVVLTKETLENAVEGHIILAEYKKEIDRDTILADVIKIIGHKNDVGVDIEAIIYKYGFVPNFSEEVLKEVEDIPNEVSPSEMVGRKDLRDEIIFTIDGDDTKDIDDAICIKRLENGNYELGVHIADVSYYVRPGTKLYDDAYERGTSVYLVDRVVPMLPHKLSNGICSLNPNVDRLAISCIMEIDTHGSVVSHSILESVINSKKQMTYKCVNKWLEEGIICDGYEEYTDKLTLMHELAKIVRKKRTAQGSIDFDTDEAKILADENGKAIDVILRERGEGEKLIEDFMIIANETVASHVYWMNLPFIYRVHGTPKEEKVNDFLNFVSSLGYKVKGKLNINHSSSIQRILNQLKDKEEYKILASLMLRAMQKATYEPDNIGHFGLASKIYTHFTSPIRRFPDNTVHRLLRLYLFENNQSAETLNYWINYMPILAEHTSLKEREAIDCEREVEDMKMAEYMMDHIGEEFTGMISGVQPFGMFVQLPNMIEGLVHISDIPGDYYIYDEKSMSLIGQKTKQRYRVGNNVKIKVISASKEESLIDFELVIDKKEEEQNI